MPGCTFCRDEVDRDGTCEVLSSDGWYCTRDKGQSGDHVACMQWTHQINIWENETPEPEPEPDPDSPLRIFCARSTAKWMPSEEPKSVTRFVVAVSITEAMATFVKFLESIDPGFEIHSISVSPESDHEVLLAE